MRFGNRDLIGLLALIVICLTAYALAPVREAPGVHSANLMLPIFAVGVVLTIVSRYRAGPRLASWRWRPLTWVLLTLAPAFLLSMAILFRLAEQTVPAPLAVLFAVSPVIVWIGSVVTVGSNGVAAGAGFLAWDRYEFRLREGDRQLRWQRRRKGNGFTTDWSLGVPRDLIDEVQSIIAAKQVEGNHG
ncbi:hypothetical protein [Botrimarina mediterranea]|uniref:Uncharacterized protein n=1 Tax=Botrimarina mediterranea TaxID=2528022 RepID=A0A518KBA0_9BACT|nr:hypothetical protein [Botrimarina mediterranea]QDV75058.1 hypothetical protein Spa11_32670 [Botrimarina mediterranea]